MDTIISGVAIVGLLSLVGWGGAWVLTRDQQCNPYGVDACACGCGIDCEDAIGG